jgi:hypothetical protein
VANSEFTLRATPQLYTERLSRDLYSPAQALAQLVANSLDAGAQHIGISLQSNELESVHRLVVEDDGCGISRNRFERSFLDVGIHHDDPLALGQHIRVMGSKGIGRLAVFRLGYRSIWSAVAEESGNRTRLTWAMTTENPAPHDLDQVSDSSASTGTRIEIDVHLPTDKPLHRFLNEQMILRELFNLFASRLLQDGQAREISVNGHALKLDDFIEERSVEELPGDAEAGRPAGTLQHLVVTQQVRMDHPATMFVAGDGWTFETLQLPAPSLPARRYVGILESPYVTEHAGTAKDALIEDEGIAALKSFASSRAAEFIARRRDERRQTFIEQARKESGYPFGRPPGTVVEKVEQGLYDEVLTLINEVADLAGAQPPLRQLLMRLVWRVLRGDDDLAGVISEVLGLDQPQVQELAELLRRTDLPSIIRVATLIVDRLDFLRVLDDVLYGYTGFKITERRHLQKMLEQNTWIFGEQWHLTTADQSVASLVEKVRQQLGLKADDDPDASIDVSQALRLIPDFYLVQNRRDGGIVHHLVVEIKAPGVRITDGHIQQLEKYADAIVEQPVFGDGHHRFTFILVSSDIVGRVERMRVSQAHLPYGYISEPSLRHPTTLWAFRWSKILDDRRANLEYLQKQVELREDPEATAYLRSKFPELFAADGASAVEQLEASEATESIDLASAQAAGVPVRQRT